MKEIALVRINHEINLDTEMKLFALKVNFVEENKKPDCQKMKSLFNPIKPEVWATLVNLRGGGSYIDIKSFNIDQLLGHSLLKSLQKSYS